MNDTPIRTPAAGPRGWLRPGIGGKTALLVIALVFAAGYTVPLWLFEGTKAIVENHEIVDLQDEASLRGWDLREQVLGLREDILQIASGAVKMEELRFAARFKPWDVPRESEKTLPLRWRQYLKVVVLDRRGRPAEPDIVFRRGVEDLQPPADLVEAALAATNRVTFPFFSDLLPLDLPRAFSEEEQPSLFRTPGIWAMLPDIRATGRTIGLLMAAEISQSPRHLWFLVNTNGQYLAHPDPRVAGQPEPASPYEKLDLAEAFRTAVWRGVQSKIQRGNLHEKTPVKTTYFFVEGLPNVEFNQAVESRVLQDEEGVRRLFDRIRAKYVAKGLAVGGLTDKIREFRLLARAPQRPEDLKKEVMKDLDAAFPGHLKAIEWRPVVTCRLGDVQLVRVMLRTAQGEQAYGLAYAAFREELSSGIRSEMASLRRVALWLALAAGAIAFAVAYLLVRPLRRVTRTAQAVMHSADEGLQDKIEAVRQALRTKRRDEVGDIAGALESLLLQVLNGHEQLRQLNADLENRVRERTRELEHALEQIKGLSQAKDEFLANVSHELRQPLNSIFGFLQFLEMSDLDDEQQGDLRKIRNAATYLRNLIGDILDYQKIIMGVLELDPQDLDAIPFIGGIRDSVEGLAREHGDRLVFDLAPDLGAIRNDAQRLQQVLVNLLTNACKFTRDGTVTLKARRERVAAGQDWLVCEVRDTGRGMKPEEQKNLFVKFKKLSAREGNKSGTGLGLVITKGLAELMGGDISFSSEFGKGTAFTVRIPAEVGHAAAAPAPPPAAAPSTAPVRPPAGTAATVLVVDDDPGVRELMSRFLGDNGYRTLTAADADEGLELARREKPDIITLDAVMPGRDGWDLLSTLKSDPATAQIPVVMVTFREEQRKGYALGAADYIVKPIDWERMRRALDRLVARGAEPRRLLVIEDDAEARELFRRALSADGWDVVEAAHGREGLDRVAERVPSAIILDLMMPVMDGFEFLTAYQQRCAAAGAPMAPILVVTAKDPTPEERARLNGLVEGVLQKGSYSRDDLLRKILSLVGGRREGEAGRPASPNTEH